MDQTLQGVSFPRAAAAKTELLQYHDGVAPCLVCFPHPWKRKGIPQPWMGFGVGDGKEAVIFHDAMMKRKRDGASGGSVGSAGSDSTPKSCEKFELDFLRHDGHFHSRRKKGPVCTFVKQYRQKWRESLIETQPVKENESLEYATMAEQAAANAKKISPLPICGVDCYQVRAEIFQKVKGLMAHKPEKLHIKARIQPNDPEMLGSLPPLELEQPEYTLDAVCTLQTASTSGEQDGYSPPATRSRAGVAATGHQAVQTVFTEDKKVQTIPSEPKQVQWAIFPTDSLSPKVGKLANEARQPPDVVQYKDSWRMPVPKPTVEIHAKDSLLLYEEADRATKATKESPGDSPDLAAAKTTSGKHHLLLYQEALEIAKEQKDLERAREQRQDFWSVYERELKRGKGLNEGEVEAENERKGKRTAEDEEEPERSPVEEVSTPVKIQLNEFLDENLTLTSTSPVSSSPRDGSGTSGEAALIVQQLLDEVEKGEKSSKAEVLVGLQGLRKVEAGDSLQSLEAMEQQLNPETSLPAVLLSPTELDCMKAAILSHNFYPRLVTSFIDQHKAGAPPDQVKRLEKIRRQVIERWRPAGIPVEKPADEDKIKKYQEILTKFERELEKPFQAAMDFSWQMEHYLDTIHPSRAKSEGGASSGSNNLKDFNDEHDKQRGFKSTTRLS